MKYDKEEVMKSLIFCSQNAKEVDPLLEASWQAGREEMEKQIREALRVLESEVPFTGEEVIAKIKEALK